MSSKLPLRMINKVHMGVVEDVPEKYCYNVPREEPVDMFDSLILVWDTKFSEKCAKRA